MPSISTHIRSRILLVILVTFFALGIAKLVLGDTVSWDGSVYVGMGKFLFSHGTVGLWETLRPVGLPIILGVFWKLGLDPYSIGQLLALSAGGFVLFFSYRIAERIYEGSGVFAAVLLAFMPLFLTYSTLPMTDTISAALVLGAVYLTLSRKEGRGRLFTAGLLAGLAFLFRFPQGLIVVVLGLIVLAQEWIAGRTLRSAFIAGCWLTLGFAIIVGPFLFVNFLAYTDPFLPMKAGSAIIGRAPAMYIEPWYFYLKSLFQSNAYVLFGIMPLIAFFIRKKWRANVPLIAGIVFLIVYGSYFTHLAHKELRYSLAFIPMATVFAGVGVSMVVNRIRGKRTALVALAILAISGICVTTLSLRYVHKTDGVYDAVIASLESYEQRTGKTPLLLSASPFPVSRGRARVLETLYDDWREVLPKYENTKPNLTHVVIDSCTLETVCRYDVGCTEGKAAALAVFSRDAIIAEDGMAGACHVTLYELHQP